MRRNTKLTLSHLTLSRPDQFIYSIYAPELNLNWFTSPRRNDA